LEYRFKEISYLFRRNQANIIALGVLAPTYLC